MHSVYASFETYCRPMEVIQTIYAILVYSLIFYYKVVENDEEMSSSGLVMFPKNTIIIFHSFTKIRHLSFEVSAFKTAAKLL